MTRRKPLTKAQQDRRDTRKATLANSMQHRRHVPVTLAKTAALVVKEPSE